MGTIARVASSVYARIIVGAVCGFLAIVGGLYAGYAWVQPRMHSSDAAPPEQPESYLNFGPGDLFPYEGYSDRQGGTGNFEQLLRDKESVVLCVSLECDPCLTLLKFWRDHMQGRLREEVQTVFMVPARSGGIPIEYEGLFSGGEVVFHNQEYWKTTYHHAYWPAIIGVDADGFVSHVQFGFSNSLDPELVRRFLT